MFVFDQYRDNDKHIMWGMKLINVWEVKGIIRRIMHKWRLVDGLAVLLYQVYTLLYIGMFLNNSALLGKILFAEAFLVGFFPFLWFVLFNFYPSKSVHTRYGNVEARKTCLLALVKT